MRKFFGGLIITAVAAVPIAAMGTAAAAPSPIQAPVTVPVNSCQLDPEISALPGADQLCAIK